MNFNMCNGLQAMSSIRLLLLASLILFPGTSSRAGENPGKESTTGHAAKKPQAADTRFSLPQGEEAGPRYFFKLDETGDRGHLRKTEPKSAKEAVDRLHTTMTQTLSDATRKRLEDIWNAGDHTPEGKGKRRALLNQWMREQIAHGSTDAASCLSTEALRLWCGSYSKTARQLFFDHLRRAFSSPAPVRSTRISRWLYHIGAYTAAPADAIYPLMDAINGVSKTEITSMDFFSFYPYNNWQTQAWRLWTSPEEYAPAVRASRGTWGANNLGFLLHDFGTLMTSNTRQGLRYWHSTYGSGNLPEAVKTTMRAIKERHEGRLPEPAVAEQIRKEAAALPPELLGFVPRCILAVLPDASPWRPLDDPEASVFMIPDTSAVFLPQWNDRLLGPESTLREDLEQLENLAAAAKDNQTLWALMAFSMKESELALPNNYRRSWLGVEGYDTFYSALELSFRRDGLDIVVTPEGPRFSRNDPMLRQSSRKLTLALHRCMLKIALLEKKGDKRKLEEACGPLAALFNKYGLWPFLCSQHEMRGISPEAFVLLVSQFRGKPEMLPAFCHAAGMPVVSGLAKTADGGALTPSTVSSLMRDFMVLTGTLHAPEAKRRSAAAAWVRFAQDMNSPEAAQIVCFSGMADILAAWEDIPASFISGSYSYTGYHLVRKALERGNRKRAEDLFSRMTERPDGYFHAPTRLALALLNRDKGNTHAAERNEQDALILAVIQTKRDSFSGYVQRKAVMEHGLLRETEKLLFLIPGASNPALIRELSRAYARERHFESAAYLAEYLLHQECMKSTPAWEESSQRAIVEWRLQADAYRALSLLRQGMEAEGERLLSRALAAMPAARPRVAEMLGELVGTCRDVRDKKAWARYAPESAGNHTDSTSVNDIFNPEEGLADPYLKPTSKWYEWHIMQGNKISRTERAKIISADYERMKGKWIRLRNEAGREFRIYLDDLAPDDIDHLLDWKEHNGIRTWEYVAEPGRTGFASPLFDGMLVDTRPQEDGSLEAVIRKTNGDIRVMPAKWQDTETRQYAAAWKHPFPMKEDNEKLRTFSSWRQARARSECANIPAVAFVLGKKGGPEEAEFKKQILGKPEEIARLNRTSAVVVCYQDEHGQWDSCGREVFLQLHFVRKGTDPDGNMPPEYLYSSGFIWSSTDHHNYIAPQFRVRREASPQQEEFRRALKEKRLMQVRALLNKDRTLAAAIFPDTHYSAIQTAMEESTPEIVSLLLDHGARVNAVTPNGVPILMAAGIRGKKEMVRLLLERGADPNLPYITAGSETYALSYCRGNADIMKLLLDAGASLDKSPGLPFDVLSGIRTPQALQLLKPYGITLQTRSVNGDTALKNAICRGDTEQVKFYLKQGADANEADRNGLVPLYHAIGIKGKPEITNLLIEHGANVNAIYKGTVSMLDHARNRHGAAQEKLLLKHGAKTAAELKKQQSAAPSGAKPEQPSKTA